jgi:predicted nucleotidyltransferase
MKKNNLTKNEILPLLRKELPYLRDKYGVRRMALYGSCARGTAGAKSDVDLLVDLSRPLGFEFVGLADHLENTLARRVDIATFATLKHSLDIPRCRPVALTIQRTLVHV